MPSLHELQELDYRISKKFATYLNYDGTLRKMFQVITLTGTAVAWLLIMPIVFLLVDSFRSEAYTMFMVNFVMMLVVFGIKLIVKRPRPEFKDDRYLSVSFDIFSFPSGHGTRAVYVAILMPMFMPGFGWIWYLWSTIMIVSRLFLGVHYISDIIAGLLLGTIAVIVLFAIGWLPVFPLSHLLIR